MWGNRGDASDAVQKALVALARSAVSVGRHPHSDLTCTGLVTQFAEDFGEVVGDSGFGLELLTAESDGDVLQGA